MDDRNGDGTLDWIRDWIRDTPRWWWACAAVIFVLAAVVRWLLFTRFPIVLTADSPDYLRAAELIAADLDFTNRQLRDWRAPGYPLFLALVQWLGPWTSSAVVVAQKLCGLLTVLLGFAAGRAVGGRVGALLLGAFLAFHPAYLLLEHLAMSETVFLLTVWIFTTTVVVTLSRGATSPQGIGAVGGALLGAGLAACILTRTPGLFFCAPVLALAVVASFLGGPFLGGPNPERSRHARRFALAAAASIALLLVPWSYRNYLLFGTFTPITNNVQRTVLAYMYLYQVVDPDMPEAQGVDGATSRRAAAGQLVRQLGDGAEAEEKASELVREQLQGNKLRYAREATEAAAGFLGIWKVGADVTYWFNRFVPRSWTLHRRNQIALPNTSSLHYDKVDGAGRVLFLWRYAGVRYLRWGRALLTLLFTGFAVTFLVSAGPRFRGTAMLPLILVIGFAAVVAGHAVVLAGHQRYALPWEGIQVLAIVAIAPHLQRARWARFGCERLCARKQDAESE